MLGGADPIVSKYFDKSQHYFDKSFLEVENCVHFFALFQDYIDKSMTYHLRWQLKVLSCLSSRSWKIYLCFCSLVSCLITLFAHTFVISSFLFKIFLTIFICCTVSKIIMIFMHNLMNFYNHYISSAFGGHSNHQKCDNFSSFRKIFWLFENWYFLHSLILICANISQILLPLLLALTKNMMSVQCSNSDDDILVIKLK